MNRSDWTTCINCCVFGSAVSMAHACMGPTTKAWLCIWDHAPCLISLVPQNCVCLSGFFFHKNLKHDYRWVFAVHCLVRIFRVYGKGICSTTERVDNVQNVCRKKENPGAGSVGWAWVGPPRGDAARPKPFDESREVLMCPEAWVQMLKCHMWFFFNYNDPKAPGLSL